MARGGSRPNAGRKPGASVERTREVANRIAADGELTPLEVMVRSMRAIFDKASGGEAVEDGTRVMSPLQLYALAADVASKAAPFIHPKLAAVEMTGAAGGPLQVENSLDVSGLTDEQIRALAAVRIDG